MKDQELSGRLVFLTPHADSFLRESNPGFAASNIVLANRVARVAKVFDWESEEGKILLREREKTGKYGEKRDPKAYKFVVSIFYPDLTKGDKKGMIVDEVMPRIHPVTKQQLFEPLPDWMQSELAESVSTKRSFTITTGKKAK
jgi:hypothetical protein